MKKTINLSKPKSSNFTDGKFKIISSDISNFKSYSEYDDQIYGTMFQIKIDTISELIEKKAYFVHDLGLLDPGSNPNNDLVGIETAV